MPKLSDILGPDPTSWGPTVQDCIDAPDEHRHHIESFLDAVGKATFPNLTPVVDAVAQMSASTARQFRDIADGLVAMRRRHRRRYIAALRGWLRRRAAPLPRYLVHFVVLAALEPVRLPDLEPTPVPALTSVRTLIAAPSAPPVAA